MNIFDELIYIYIIKIKEYLTLKLDIYLFDNVGRLKAIKNNLKNNNNFRDY